MTPTEEFQLSGFKIKTDLTKARDAAEGHLENLQAKIIEFKAKAAQSSGEADQLRKEAANLIIAGKSDLELQTQIKEHVRIQDESRRMAEQLQGMIPDAQKAIQQAQGDIDDFIHERLQDARALRAAQLEEAIRQRAAGMSTTRDGKVRSTVGGTATACLGWCEYCRQPIARFDPASIQQPVTGKDFRPRDDRYPYPPFPERATIEFFKCPTCNHRPWGEPDKVWTTDGFFSVPAVQESVDTSTSA